MGLLARGAPADIGGVISSFLPPSCQLRSRLINQKSTEPSSAGLGFTPLMQVSTGQRALALGGVKLLVEAGADPDIRTTKGYTALSVARLFRLNDIVAYLER